MPRRKHSSAARHENCLDGSQLSADELMFIASQIGQLWKRFRRRHWPHNIKDTIATVLLELCTALIPSGALDEFGSSERTPSDVRGIAELMKCLAILEKKNSKSHFFPETLKKVQNRFPKRFRYDSNRFKKISDKAIRTGFGKSVNESVNRFRKRCDAG